MAFVAIGVGLSAVAGSSLSQAQSLSDALSGPAKAAADAAGNGAWSTVVETDPPKPTAAQFDHWQAKITLANPSFKHPNQIASGGPSDKPYALHGPISDGIAKPAPDHAMKGLASFYGISAGTRTATGETFDPTAMTAAHRTLPFGTRVRVTRVDTGDSVIVRINDRGPFKPGRVIDLSEKAAEDLRITDKGLADVRLEVVDRDDQPARVETVAQRSLRR
ncbi:MAG: septal ring lytic transglycosylase RlpA family protein [Hyphomicrobium sp.]|uniref:septal ring lytic transglycosylase RlpA family protein n=1 Tax=Hyphomicrobium sp. TaxID=82 RepID=UPI0039E5DAAD